LCLCGTCGTLVSVKFIEQQLISALAETPHETECCLSTAVLVSIGLAHPQSQLEWLRSQRGEKDGKVWRYSGAHWEYAADVPETRETTSIPAAIRLNWRTVQPVPPERPTRILVKPVIPLKAQLPTR
jgi:hypothetical protein